MRIGPPAAMMLLSLALAGSPALGADATEIAFWESVRESRDPAELRAYLERYPNGTFAVLANRRLAALQPGARPVPPAASAPAASAPVASAPVASTPVAWTTPRSGDSWTYR